MSIKQKPWVFTERLKQRLPAVHHGVGHEDLYCRRQPGLDDCHLRLYPILQDAPRDPLGLLLRLE